MKRRDYLKDGNFIYDCYLKNILNFWIDINCFFFFFSIIGKRKLEGIEKNVIFVIKILNLMYFFLKS